MTFPSMNNGREYVVQNQPKRITEALDKMGTEADALVDLPAPFENTNFLTGDSPALLDFNAALGRNATTVSIINDGPGNFTIELSNDGSTFGSPVTMKSGEAKDYEGISIDTVRVTWVSNSAYRAEGI